MSGFLKQTDTLWICRHSGNWVTEKFDDDWVQCNNECGPTQVKDLPDWAVSALLEDGRAVVKVRAR